jgi:hypothetical protein
VPPHKYFVLETKLKEEINMREITSEEFQSRLAEIAGEQISVKVVGERNTELGIPAYRYQCSCGVEMFGGGMIKHLCDKHGVGMDSAYELIDGCFREVNEEGRHR